VIRRYQISWEVVGLERGPLSLVSITEELLEWKSSGPGSRKPILMAVGTRCADHATPLCPQKLAITSPTCGGRLVGIVRLRTKATEFSFIHAVFFLRRRPLPCPLLKINLKPRILQKGGRTSWMGGWAPSQGRYLHRTEKTQNSYMHTYSGFETAISVLELAKIFRTLDTQDQCGRQCYIV
jgi:hypothetical protein